jgi:hypothetical protein
MRAVGCEQGGGSPPSLTTDRMNVTRPRRQLRLPGAGTPASTSYSRFRGQGGRGSSSSRSRLLVHRLAGQAAACPQGLHFLHLRRDARRDSRRAIPGLARGIGLLCALSFHQAQPCSAHLFAAARMIHTALDGRPADTTSRRNISTSRQIASPLPSITAYWVMAGMFCQPLPS